MLRDHGWVIVLDCHSNQSYVNNVISGDEVRRYFREEIPGAKCDVGRKPSFRRTLA